MNLTIVGTGLIGSAMAMGLRGTFARIVGVNNNPAHVKEALNRGIVDEFLPLEHAIANADAIVLATPVDSIIRLLPRVLDTMGEESTVIDVGSTKELICNNIRKHPRRSQFVASHPMAGIEASGPKGANPHLFRGRKVVICEQELSSPQAQAMAQSIFGILGMGIINLSAAQHDRAVAQVSHLPQLLSYSMAALMASTDQDDEEIWRQLAASGFDSTTRLAASPPHMWLPIFEQNRDEIARHMDRLMELLARIREALITSNTDRMSSFIERANRIRNDFVGEYGRLG